jgi:GH15 family glucan-1,4-alpha-glucosidase
VRIDGLEAESGYRPISDYALIGNTFTAALVAPDGAIDWCCLPHFDSGAVFWRLLDARRGGCFRVGPVAPCDARRHYLEDSAVLVTEFEDAAGHVRLTDCMPAPPLRDAEPVPHAPRYRMLLRRIEGLRGRMEIELLFKPGVDFGRQPTRLQPAPGGCSAIAAEQSLHLTVAPGVPLQAHDGAVRARLQVQAGQVMWVVLSHDGDAPAAGLPEDPARLLEETLRHWRDWCLQCSYRGPYEAEVALSARVLKLLTFTPTGAIVAAPTTSLPERIGGVRNWDYRFCWLRDSALVLHSLLSIGYENAADRFFQWLTALWRPDRRLQIMYRLDAGEHLPEVVLPHLEGYCGSRPVRVGNGAARQVQLDIYGHLLDAAWVYLEGRGTAVREELARVLAFLADEAARHWRQPDQGLWEMRREPSHHVSSKLMCWVALDRALKLAQAGRLRGDTALWQREREAIRQAIHTHGFNPRLGAFTQTLGGETLDASVLMMSIVGFLPATDPRMRSTVTCIREHLTQRGLVYRYQGRDGFDDGEGSFAICSFWMVDNLALLGRVDEARALFEHLLSFASDLGLLSEEIEPADGRLLGNYPQGYTHLALIRSAQTIARAGNGPCTPGHS